MWHSSKRGPDSFGCALPIRFHLFRYRLSILAAFFCFNLVSPQIVRAAFFGVRSDVQENRQTYHINYSWPGADARNDRNQPATSGSSRQLTGGEIAKYIIGKTIIYSMELGPIKKESFDNTSNKYRIDYGSFKGGGVYEINGSQLCTIDYGNKRQACRIIYRDGLGKYRITRTGNVPGEFDIYISGGQ